MIDPWMGDHRFLFKIEESTTQPLVKNMKKPTQRLSLENLESRNLYAADLAADLQVPTPMAYMSSQAAFYNASKPADVDGDGSVSPIDALRLIDMLNRIGSMDLASIRSLRAASGAEGEAEPIGNVDTNNDGSLNPVDVLIVIDELNSPEGIASSESQWVEFDGSELPIAYSTFAETSFAETSEGDPAMDLPTDISFDDVLKFFDTLDDLNPEIKPSTEFDIDQVFDESGVDIEWVKRTSIDEELPLMFMDESVFPVLFGDDLEVQPVYATMNPAVTPEVAGFSQGGLFAQVVRRNLAENTSVSASGITYFSSNFLKGLK